VALSVAAAATKKLKLGTGVCLVIQRDTIQTAKAVASLDQVSGGRFLFGIGGGWNQDEMEDHGTVYATRFKKMREQIEAMREIWTKSKPEYHGETVDFPPMMTWPKPVQNPLPVIVGGAFPHGARRALRYGNGWIPHSRRPQYEDVTDFLPQFRQMAAEAGRDPAEVPVTVWGAPENADRLQRYRDQAVARVVVSLPAEPAAKTLPRLDRWAELIRHIGH
jgi:probable F420-dependent oxidoreductase